MAQIKYKVIRSSKDTISLEANLNNGAQGGWKLLKVDFILDQFNGDGYNLIFEKIEE